MKILVINGPNLNMLDKRDPEKYGNLALEMIENKVKETFREEEFTFLQSNKEGDIVDAIQGAPDNFDGLIINAGGFSHTSVAIRDALEICSISKIEVHLSNLAAREDFRHTMITAPKCDGYLSGFKENGYLAAVYLLKLQVNT